MSLMDSYQRGNWRRGLLGDVVVGEAEFKSL